MLPDEETMHALKESILLPFVLTIFDSDKKAIQQSKVKFQAPYIALIEQAEQKSHSDLLAVKRLLNKAGLKVFEEKRDEWALNIRYKYRGYQHEARYILEHLKSETEVRMKGYLSNQNREKL